MNTETEQKTIHEVLLSMNTYYFSRTFQNNEIKFTTEYDAISLEYLEVTLPPYVSVHEFKADCRNTACLELQNSHKNVFLSIPLRFMMLLNGHQSINDKVYIKIPHYLFLNAPKQMNHCTFKLQNCDQLFSSCNLIFKVRKDQNHTVDDDKKDDRIQVMTSVELNSPESPLNEFVCNTWVWFNDVYNGFYIECKNVEDISGIRLDLNGLNQFTYDKSSILEACVKINENLIYLPFKKGRSMYDIGENQLYTEARNMYPPKDIIHFGRIERSILTIQFDTPQKRCCIYGLGAMPIRFDSGLRMKERGAHEVWLAECHDLYNKHYTAYCREFVREIVKGVFKYT